MNIMNTKKALNWLLEAFIWVYAVIICSLLLPLTIGIILLFIAPLAQWLFDLSWIVKIPIWLVTGIFLALKYKAK